MGPRAQTGTSSVDKTVVVGEVVVVLSCYFPHGEFFGVWYLRALLDKLAILFTKYLQGKYLEKCYDKKIDSIMNSIMEHTKVKDILRTIKRKKWKWARHVI